MNSIANPWLALPLAPPFVLPQDALAIRAHNEWATKRQKPEHQFHVDLMPEPYFGNPNVPVVALLLNPGYKPDDNAVHADPVFRNLARRSMAHKLSPTPFLHLIDNLDNPGCRWWRKRTRQLPPECRVAHNLFALEYVGYKSRRFRLGQPIPSIALGVRSSKNTCARRGRGHERTDLRRRSARSAWSRIA